MFTVTHENVIANALTIARSLLAIRRAIANESSDYNRRLIACLGACRLVWTIRTALIAAENELHRRMSDGVNRKYVGQIDDSRSSGYDPKRKTFSGSAASHESLDIPALTILRDEIVNFRQLSHQLADDCENLIGEIASLVDANRWANYVNSGKTVGKDKRFALKYTREAVSYLRLFIRDRAADGRLPSENVICGIVDRHSSHIACIPHIVARLKTSIRLNRKQSTGSAPSYTIGSMHEPYHRRLFREPAKLYTRSGSNGSECLQLIAARYQHIYPIDTFASMQQLSTGLLGVCRREGNRVAARWVRLMQSKGLLSTRSGDFAQVIIDEPRELTAGESMAQSRLPEGHCIRVMPIVRRGDRYSRDVGIRREFAIMLLGPEAGYVNWAHEATLTPASVDNVIARFLRELQNVADTRERQRVANLSQAERAKAFRKQRLTLACEIRNLGEFTFRDSRNAGNCEAGTLAFCASIGIRTDRVTGRQLAYAWRKAGYPSDRLLLNVVQHVKQTRQTAVAGLSAIADSIAAMEPIE